MDKSLLVAFFMLFCVAQPGVLRAESALTEGGKMSFSFKYDGEPSVIEVQRMAIEYAEVSPEKIRKWRSQARWRALLPRFSVDFSEARDDNIDIYKSSSTSYIIEGPREVNNDIGLDLTWDLSELIWSNAQTSIDVRSKLMVQLRMFILEEVTRLYFERKRLLFDIERVEIDLEGEITRDILFDKRLKVEELTGYIDALTGGQFSKAINGK